MTDPNGNPIVVVGAGGHAKVLIDCLRYAGWNVIGCVSMDQTVRECAGIPVLGGDDRLAALRADGIGHAFCAIGQNDVRDKRGQELIELGFRLPSVKGPGAVVSASVRIGLGAAFLPGSIVNVDCIVGDLAIINTNANVDHDGVIGRAAHVGPGASLAGEVVVGDRSFLATGCAVIPRSRIGADTVVGAGSVVVGNLPDRVLAYGNPARIRRQLR